jgi:hypothetical protein
MGYIIIDEEKLKEKIYLWNNSNYTDKVLGDVYSSRADYACMLKALQQEEKRIDEDIKKLQLQKDDIAMLMKYANNGI